MPRSHRTTAGTLEDERQSRGSSNLAEAHRYTRSLIEASLDPLVTISPEGRITDVNEATATATGVAREQLIGSDFADYFTDPDLARAGYRKVFEQGYVVDYPLAIRHVSGREIDVLYNASVYRNEDGGVVGVFAAARDVTERLRAEEMARRYEAIAESTDDAIIAKSLDGRILTWNRGAERLYGFTAEEALGRPVSLVVPPDRTAEVSEVLAIVGRGERLEHYETVRVTKDGRRLDVSLSVAPLRDERGTVIGASTIARDISARRRTERKVALLNATARALVHAHDEVGLLAQVCTIATDEAGYRFAWVGAAVEEGARVLPIACAGVGQDYLERAQIRWDDSDRGRGPTGRAVRERTPQVSRDILRDPAMAPWRADALARGYASSAVIPFVAAEEVLVFHAYADRPDAFDADELATLQQMAGELALGVASFRARVERERVEARLRQSEERYRYIAEQSSDLIVVHDLDGRIEYVNEATGRLLGSSQEELVGHALVDFLATEDRASFASRQAQRSSGDQSTLTYEVSVIGASGQPTPFEVRSSIVSKPGHEPSIELVGRDITERRRADAAQRAANAYNRSLIEASLDPLVTIGPEGTITDVNAATEHVTGLARTQLIGTDFSSYFTDPVRARAGYQQVFRDGVVRDYALEIRHRDGHLTPVLYNASVYRDAQGEVRGVFAAARDVTEVRRTEVALRASEERYRELNAELEARVAARTQELEQANRNLEAFTYSVSHDLRTPLRALSGFSEALVEEYEHQLDEVGLDYLHRIEAASVRMAQLIDDLLHLSRVTRAEIRREPVDLSAEVAAILDQMQRAEPGRHVQVEVEPSVRAVADRQLIRTVLENLLNNAWKFTSLRDCARIEFGTLPNGPDEVCYFVRDNGAGFDATYADQLFQPFQRLHSATEYPGTGIGLASVRRIIERHGGRTWAEGNVDAGATIYFTLAAPGDQPGD